MCDKFHLVLISVLSKPDGNPMNSKQPANQCHEEVKGWCRGCRHAYNGKGASHTHMQRTVNRRSHLPR